MIKNIAYFFNFLIFSSVVYSSQHHSDRIKYDNKDKQLDTNRKFQQLSNFNESSNKLNAQENSNCVTTLNAQPFVKSSVSKALLQVSPACESIIKAHKVPAHMTEFEVKSEISEAIKPSHVKIDNQLSMTAAKPHQLYCKQVAFDLEHIVNLYPKIESDNSISLQGGHMYRVLASFMKSGFLKVNQNVKNSATNCWLFDGYDNITGKRFYKTAFPQGWTPEDVYQALRSGTQVGATEKDGKGHMIVRLKINHKKNPEFMVRLVLYPRVDNKNTWEVITAFPEGLNNF